MRYGFVLPGADVLSGPGLAREAEEAGWDGVFVPDCIEIQGEPMGDPWVVMAAMAMRTERVRIGPMVTPLSRRRPWKVARETATLDILSNGRLVLPVGLGALDDAGFEKVGEATDRRVRAAMLDEALDIVAGLWSGERFSYEGEYFKVRELTFLPRPVQRPRIPVWVVAAWPREKSMRRALRWDGLLPNTMNPDGSFRETTPEDVRAMREYVVGARGEGLGVSRDEDLRVGDADGQRLSPNHSPLAPAFDIVMEGVTPGEDVGRARGIVEPFAEAGATWWIESMWTGPNGPEEISRRLRQGPPRVE
jgi:alkanesulfonate monooxygenase SsuD/methylene tetrahydromethanopterin reductase-like flavin-dependent oxidoreductase (luciferase family)